MTLYTRKEAATRLHISVRSLDRRLADGSLECYRLGDGPRAPIRIAEEHITSFLVRHSSRHEDMAQRAQQIMGS